MQLPMRAPLSSDDLQSLHEMEIVRREMRQHSMVQCRELSIGGESPTPYAATVAKLAWAAAVVVANGS